MHAMNHSQRPNNIRRLDSSINGGKGYENKNSTQNMVFRDDRVRGKEKVEASSPVVMSFVLHVAPILVEELDEPPQPLECWVDDYWAGYWVYVFVGPEMIGRTALKGKNQFGEVLWYDSFEIPVEEPLEQAQLHVELVRVGAVEEPGCSTGEKVVGRGRYRLRKLSQQRGSKMLEFRLTLRRPEGGYGGEMKIAAKLQRRWFHPIDVDHEDDGRFRSS